MGHHKNQIEFIEVFLCEFACNQCGNIDAEFFCSVNGSFIWSFTSMPSACSCRIHRDFQTARFKFFSQNAFRHRRSADVAQADHKYPHFLLLIHYLATSTEKFLVRSAGGRASSILISSSTTAKPYPSTF